MSRGADTKANTLGAGGALELRDLGLVEDGRELGDALDSDRVAQETATEGWSEDGQKSGVSAGADTKANAWGGGAPEVFDLRLREDFHELEQA